MASASHLILPNALFARVNFVRSTDNEWSDQQHYMPDSLQGKYCIIFEPAIATGALTERLIELLIERGCISSHIIIVAINAADTGLDLISKNSRISQLLLDHVTLRWTARGG